MSGSNRIIKHSVLTSGLHEADIRPPALMNEFLRLSQRDAQTYFSDPASMEVVSCPACAGDKSHGAYERGGFRFVTCVACGSLFVNPRPSAASLTRYFQESAASQFRIAQFSEDTATQRRYHLLRGLASWVGQVVALHMPAPSGGYGDYRTYLPPLFDEIAELEIFPELYGIEPRVGFENRCAAKVATTTLQDVPPLSVVSAFEKLEHQHSPEAFLRALGDRLLPGGLIFLTTRTCTGFDLQVLGAKSPYIFVPEHLNLLSIDGLERLVQRSGFELIELSTPGQLDVEMVLQACSVDPSITLPPFLQCLLQERNELAHRDFQAFLQKHRLSSHVRLALRKPA